MTPKKAAKPKSKIGRLFNILIIATLAIFFTFCGVLILISLFSISILRLGYYFNWTSSMPIGLYSVAPPQNLKIGDDVVVCLPQAIGSLGLERGYLDSGKGCPGGYNPIIKELIATPQDKVTLTQEQIIVNGKTYFAPVQSLDHSGKPLGSIARKTYTCQYWLYGAGNPIGSWDSRYWGGVSEENIIHQAHPILTY